MIDFLRDNWVYVIPILLLLTVIVTIHELGHFFAARTFGVAMDRFAIGFGRPLWSRTDKHGVEWRIGWIPLGGYVRFSGDSNDASVPNPEELEGLRQQIEEQLGKDEVNKYYHFKPVWQRAVIAAAGPAANFILAIAAFTILLLSIGEPVSPPVVSGFTPGSVAESAGFQRGDVIKKVDGRRVRDFRAVANYVTFRAGEAITFELERNTQPVVIVATPRRISITDDVTKISRTEGRIGIQSPPQTLRRYNIGQAMLRSVGMTGEVIGATGTYIRRIVTGRESGDQLSGVVGMANMTGKTIKSVTSAQVDGAIKGRLILLNVLGLIATISIGLGFLNLMPIPVLDGGHLMFYAYEAIARRPAGPRFQAASFRVGLALVLCLMLFATWNDLQHLQAFKFLGGLFS